MELWSLLSSAQKLAEADCLGCDRLSHFGWFRLNDNKLAINDASEQARLKVTAN